VPVEITTAAFFSEMDGNVFHCGINIGVIVKFRETGLFRRNFRALIVRPAIFAAFKKMAGKARKPPTCGPKVAAMPVATVARPPGARLRAARVGRRGKLAVPQTEQFFSLLPLKPKTVLLILGILSLVVFRVLVWTSAGALNNYSAGCCTRLGGRAEREASYLKQAPIAGTHTPCPGCIVTVACDWFRAAPA
jgi:hypothetical protein